MKNLLILTFLFNSTVILIAATDPIFDDGFPFRSPSEVDCDKIEELKIRYDGYIGKDLRNEMQAIHEAFDDNENTIKQIVYDAFSERPKKEKKAKKITESIDKASKGLKEMISIIGYLDTSIINLHNDWEMLDEQSKSVTNTSFEYKREASKIRLSQRIKKSTQKVNELGKGIRKVLGGLAEYGIRTRNESEIKILLLLVQEYFKRSTRIKNEKEEIREETYVKIREDYSKYLSENNRLKTKNENLKKSNDEIKSFLLTKDGHIASLDQQIGKRNEKLKQTEEYTKLLYSQIDDLEKTNNKKEVGIRIKNDSINLLEERIQNLFDEHESMQCKIFELNSESDKKEQQIQNDNQKKSFLWLFISLLTVCIATLLWGLVKWRAKNYELAISQEKLDASKNLIELQFEELNHRVKNNLQDISSLLKLQLKRVYSSESKSALKQTQSRVLAIQLIYEFLAKNREGDRTYINLKEYIEKLVDNCLHLEELGKGTYDLNIDDVHLNTEATKDLGIIFAELLSNWKKHVFSVVDQPTFNLQVKEESEELHFSFKDNGIEFDFEGENSGKKGIGLQIIHLFTQKLKAGSLEYKYHQGNHFQFSVPLAA